MAVTKALAALIKDRMRVRSVPWQFAIIGKSGGNTDRMTSAHSTWEKVKAWAEGAGAECTLVEDEFQRYYAEGAKGPLGNKRLIVEITDPAAQVLEGIIKGS